MSNDDKKSDPKLNRFTDGPNYTRMVAGAQREKVQGSPEQWLEALPARYQIQGPIGQGGMGQVYLATDVGETGQGLRQVAIKLVLGELAGSQQAYERFVQEMHIAEQLEHENIVQVLTHGKTLNGVPYLVMQYLEGGSLLDRIRSVPGQRLPVEEVIDIGMQVCTALMVAHDFGVIHRDIKPGNILVRQERYPRPRLMVKLADFGLARSLETSNHSMSAMVGTFGYRSPEQRSGGSVDVRSDLYSLGATLFHACSGEAPEGVIDFDDVPEVIQIILRKALAKRPAERYASASQMYEALASCRSIGAPGSLVVVNTPEPVASNEKDATKEFISPAERSAPTPPQLSTKPVLPVTPEPVVSAEFKSATSPPPPSASNSLFLPQEFTNSLGMKFRLIEPGTFMMGSQCRVTLTKPYYICIYAVTQSEYQRVMGSNPSYFKGGRHPVEQVSWDDAMKFIKKLKALTEERSLGRVYRLPTEAEWEYACRAGSSTAYCFGDDESSLGEYAWYYRNSDKKTHSIGEKRPNDWGLYDMHGNVWEWCSDWNGAYPSGSVTDPIGVSNGSGRVFRGGSWSNDAAFCRSSNRDGYVPSFRGRNLGFRLVLSSLETSPDMEWGRKGWRPNWLRSHSA